MDEPEDPNRVGSSEWLETRLRWWRERIKRLAYVENLAAGAGNYGEALRRNAMREATELCLADLEDESASNTRMSEPGAQPASKGKHDE